MAKLSELHKLIKSLDIGEKRYVNLYVGRFSHKSKEAFLFQFDQLSQASKIKDYNKSELLSRYGIKRFSEFNTNLFNIVLKALVLYKVDNSNSLSLFMDTMKTEVLIAKKMYNNAEKLIHQNETALSNYGFSEIMAYLSKLKYKIGTARSMPFDQQIAMQDERIQRLKRSINESEYIQLNFEMTALLSKVYYPRTSAQRQEYLRMLKHPLLLSVESAHTFYAKHYYYMIKVPLMTMSGKREEVLETCQEAIAFVRENIDKRIDPIPETFQLRRYLNAQITLKDPARLLETAADLEEMLPSMKSETQRMAIWSNTIDARLNHSLLKDKYAEGVRYFEDVALESYEKNTQMLKRIDAKALLIARLYFLNGDYDKSLSYCDKAVSGAQYQFLPFVVSAKFLTLMNHYKLNNDLLLPYAVQSLQRSLQQAKQLYKPERILLNFLGKFKDINKLKKQLVKLYSQLKEERENPFNDSFFQNGDYLKWLEEEVG